MGASERDLARWSESLAAIARTGLGFTDNLYERERFEEVLHIAADIRAAAREDDEAAAVLAEQETPDWIGGQVELLQGVPDVDPVRKILIDLP